MTSSINRRSLVKGATIAAPVAAAAAWSTPALAGSTPVNPYQASNSTPGGNMVTTGLFVSVRGENIGTNADPLYIDFISGGSGNGVVDRNWSDAEDRITGAPAIRNTNGISTPYGPLGQVSANPGQVPSFQTYGGTGMWFSSPVVPTGSQTGDYFTDYKGVAGGKTTLKAGASFTLSIRIEYTSATSQAKNVPYMGTYAGAGTWSQGKVQNLDAKNVVQGSRVTLNGAPIQAVFGAWNQTQQNGKFISYGDIVLTTLADATVSTASNGAPQFQQLTLVPPLKVRGQYQVPGNLGDVLAISATIASNGNAQFVSTVNGQAVTQIQELKTTEAHLTGPGANV